MRFLALIITLCALSFATAPADGAFPNPFSQYQPAAGHRPPRIPMEARRVRRAYDNGLNPVRPLRMPSTPAPEPDCAAVCVIDPYNGNILYGFNANARRQVASTQKIITALCVCDTKDLDKVVTIKASDRMARPIRLNLRAGEQYTRRALMQAMLTGSFNDVALSLARDCAGSVDAFVDRMNERARRMRMFNTHFANPNGLPAEQYSTAYDMALAACYAYNNKTIRSMINIPAYEFRRNNGSVRMIRSTNRLLTSHPWVQGMKTGYTNLAGKCLISCASSNGRAVIVVILGSTSRKIWGESLKYLRWALEDA